MLVAIKCSPVPSRQVECVTRFAMGLVRETPQTWSWLLPHARHILLCASASLRTCKPNGHVGTPGAMFSRPRWNGALNGHAHPDAHIPDARTPACPAQPNTRLPTSQLPWLGCAWAKRRVSSHVARTREGSACKRTSFFGFERAISSFVRKSSKYRPPLAIPQSGRARRMPEEAVRHSPRAFPSSL